MNDDNIKKFLESSKILENLPDLSSIDCYSPENTEKINKMTSVSWIDDDYYVQELLVYKFDTKSTYRK